MALYIVGLTSDCIQTVNKNICIAALDTDTFELASDCIQNSQTQAQNSNANRGLKGTPSGPQPGPQFRTI